MPRFFLELHKGELHPRLRGTRGASNYDPNEPDLYWAVLTSIPSTGSDLADFFAPEGPTASASAISHGNDSVAVNALTAPVSQAGIWWPKYPPYSFEVTAPGGEEFDLIPPEIGSGGSGGDFVIFSVPIGIADALGVWAVRVSLRSLPNAAPNDPQGLTRLPEVIDSRRAALNPDLVNFSQVEILQQPLLILDADGNPGDGSRLCPEARELIVIRGCALGIVTFRAEITGSAADVEEVVWDFGDGEFEEQLAGPFVFPLTASHNYSAVPAEPARVSVRRRAGCTPRTISETVDVPACSAPGCPSIRSIEVSDGCVPGAVSFRLSIDGTAADVEEITWTWGDGSESVFSGANLAGGLQPTHTYADVPPADASVALRFSASCRPSVVSGTVDLPRCPTLDGIDVDGCAGEGEEVTFTSRGQNLGQASSFLWGFGDGSTTTGGATVTHQYNERREHTVEVTMTSPRGCAPRQQTASSRVPACEEEDNGGGGEASSSCMILFIMFWAALILTLVLLMIASCTLDPAAIGLAIGVGLGTLLLLFLWLFICGESACSLLNMALNFLAALAIVWPVIVFLIGIFMPCVLLGGFIGEGFVGTVFSIAFLIAKAMGCLVEQTGGAAAARRSSARSSLRKKARGGFMRKLSGGGCEGCGGRGR